MGGVAVASRLRLPQVCDAVLLDLDGTLSDAGPAIAASVALALEQVGAAALSPQALRAFVGPPLEDSFAELLADPVLAERAVTAYRACHDQLASPLYDGVPQALAALRSTGVPLALATSKPQRFAEQVVSARRLDLWLDLVVGSDRSAGRRTKGDVVGRALALLGHPRAAVMVGDRRHDVAGAAEHQVACVGALWGYGDVGELERAGAAALVASPAALVDLLLPRLPSPR